MARNNGPEMKWAPSNAALRIGVGGNQYFLSDQGYRAPGYWHDPAYQGTYAGAITGSASSGYRPGGMGGASSGSGGYASAFEAAKAANKAREKEITEGRTSLRDRVMGNINAQSGQQLTDLRNAYGSRAAGIQQQAVSSGLAGTTVLPTMLQGNTRQQMADERRLGDEVAQRRSGMDMAANEQLYGFRERITDAYPDLNQMLALNQGLGASGGGGIGGGYYVPNMLGSYTGNNWQSNYGGGMGYAPRQQNGQAGWTPEQQAMLGSINQVIAGNRVGFGEGAWGGSQFGSPGVRVPVSYQGGSGGGYHLGGTGFGVSQGSRSGYVPANQLYGYNSLY